MTGGESSPGAGKPPDMPMVVAVFSSLKKTNKKSRLQVETEPSIIQWHTHIKLQKMKPTLTVNQLLLLIPKTGHVFTVTRPEGYRWRCRTQLAGKLHLLRLQQRGAACMHADQRASVMERAIKMQNRDGWNGADLALKNDSGYYKAQKALFNYF